MGAIKEPVQSSYDTDFYGWTTETARALRERRFGDIDIENLGEEVESMGKSEKRELASRLAKLLMHLLKWEYQAPMRSTSWAATIKVQRQQTLRVLARNPSLRTALAEVVEDAYDDARLDAERETRLSLETFPQECPYAIDDVLTVGWLPPPRD